MQSVAVVTESHGAVVGAIAKATSRPIFTSPIRLCTECEIQIPEARMEATRGTATKCVPCKERTGDEPLVRRYDETTPDGDTVSTTFTSNPYVELALERVKNVIAPDAAFDIAVGDDSNLVRERGAGIGAGALRDAIVDVEDALIDKIDREREQAR